MCVGQRQRASPPFAQHNPPRAEYPTIQLSFIVLALIPHDVMLGSALRVDFGMISR